MSKTKAYNRDVMLVLAACFFYMAPTAIVMPVIAGYANFLGGGAFVMGFIGGAMNLISLGCRPVAGNLADRMDKFSLTRIGSAMMLTACVIYAVTPNTVLLVFARVLHGVGYACASVCMSTWLAQLVPPNEVGSAMGIYGTVQAVSVALCPSIGIRMENAFGYRSVFFLAALCALAVLVLIYLVKDPGAPARRSSDETWKLEIVDRNVFPVALLMMLFTIPYGAVQGFIVSYAEAVGLSVEVDLFFVLYAAALVVLRVGFRKYFGVVPYRRFLFISLACSVAAMVCLQTMDNYVLMVLAAVFMAGGYGIMCSVSQATAILLAGPGRRGLGNSTYYVGIDGGLSLGPIIGGVLFGSVDLSLFFMMLGVTSLISVAVYFIWKKQLDKA